MNDLAAAPRVHSNFARHRGAADIPFQRPLYPCTERTRAFVTFPAFSGHATTHLLLELIRDRAEL
jgi:hypothetical protein